MMKQKMCYLFFQNRQKANDRINMEENVAFQHVSQYLSNNLITSMKINHSLDETTQNFQSFKAYLFLEDDVLTIVNRKPCIGKTPEDFSLEGDVVQSLESVKAMVVGSQLVESENGLVYELTKSSACTNVEEITGLVFGGTTSRFWLYRKHFSCLPFSKLQNLPFHAWDCLTLQTKARDIDLVIPD